jgi:hypothetical protein
MYKHRQRAQQRRAWAGVVGCRFERYACKTAAIGAAPGVERRRRGWRGCSAGSGERTAVGGGE